MTSTRVVSKDSGGRAAAKIEAASRLGLPVVLVARPPQPGGPTVHNVDEAVAWLEAALW
jgi:precorrin-6A/cobalt-precorrin-6A reductase